MGAHKLRMWQAVIGVTLLVVGVLAPAVAHAEPRHLTVVGGTSIGIEAAPWQVVVRGTSGSLCGGSILSPTRILTAAHCVIPAGQSAPQPPAAFKVLAGVTEGALGAVPPPGAQVTDVAGVAVHPLYDAASLGDDVAVLTLARPLILGGPRAKAVALAPVGGGPAPGAAVVVTGYGVQVEGRDPDGRLYAATLTAVSDDQCRPKILPNNSASVQCVAPGPAGCYGDSGGPLTSGGVQIGIASYVSEEGCGTGPGGFADVTAPEVRAFIDGASIPTAPRLADQPVLSGVTPPVEGSRLSCAPGTWSNGPSFAYVFVNDATGVALQSGASPTFVIRRGHAGAQIACIVQASNAGGTSTARTGTAMPVMRDLVPPASALRSVRCRQRRCTVRVAAADPNSNGRLRVRVTAKPGRGKARRLHVKRVSETAFRARSRQLPRGRTIIRVQVRDGAGNRRPDLIRRVRVR